MSKQITRSQTGRWRSPNPKGLCRGKNETVSVVAMTRWAYMTTECASLEEMNHYGADGWEFVGEVHVMVPDPEYEGQETSRRPMLFRRPATEGK